jgi:heme A synthase
METPKVEPEPEPESVPPSRERFVKKAQTFALIFLVLSILFGSLSIVFSVLSNQGELYTVLAVLFTTAAGFSILFLILFALLYLPERGRQSKRIR